MGGLEVSSGPDLGEVWRRGRRLLRVALDLVGTASACGVCLMAVLGYSAGGWREALALLLLGLVYAASVFVGVLGLTTQYEFLTGFVYPTLLPALGVKTTWLAAAMVWYYVALGVVLFVAVLWIIVDAIMAVLRHKLG